MLGRTHVSVGLTAGLGLIYFDQQILNPVSSLVPSDVIDVSISDMIGRVLVVTGLLLAVALGSLLPDIDSKKSTLGRHAPFVEEWLGHRGVTHTIWALLILGFVVWILPDPIQLFGWFLFMGYALHIFCDWLSRGGVDLLYPFGQGYEKYDSGAMIYKGFRPNLYRVGGSGENFFYGLFRIATIVLLILLIWSSIAPFFQG